MLYGFFTMLQGISLSTSGKTSIRFIKVFKYTAVQNI